MPITCVVGELSSYRGPSTYLARIHPAACICEVAGTSHTIHLEDPDRFLTAMDQAANSHGPRGRQLVPDVVACFNGPRYESSKRALERSSNPSRSISPIAKRCLRQLGKQLVDVHLQRDRLVRRGVSPVGITGCSSSRLSSRMLSFAFGRIVLLMAPIAAVVATSHQSQSER